jgi:mRNA-degrading endonuclease RelE of RelBE toxin-antitoxin system
MISVKLSKKALRDLKLLKKKYHKIEEDLERLIIQLSKGNLLGDRIQNLQGFRIYKARIRNTSNNQGKSGGFRIIYYLQTEKEILMLSIYSKSQKENISKNEILEILEEENR